MKEDCLFCKIVAGQEKADVVYEDEKVMAFKDINPEAPVHLLIIPKKHIATTMDLTVEDNNLVGHIYQTAKKIAKEQGFGEDGFRIVNNCNDDGGQIIYHIHYHLLAGEKLGKFS